MLNEQNKKDILDMYRDGYSRTEIKEEYSGIDPREIDDICSEEDDSWTIED